MTKRKTARMPPPKVVLYHRVSGQGQLKQSGLQRQFECTYGYATRRKLDVIGVFSDQGPGTPKNLPGLITAVKMCRAQSAMLLVEDCSRASRDGHEPLEKVLKGVKMVETAEWVEYRDNKLAEILQGLARISEPQTSQRVP